MFSIPIPQHIIDIIIDQIHDDHDILEKCAVVSKSFLVRCRKHLFSRIFVDSSETAERLWLLLSSSPHIAPYIRDLRLTSVLNRWIDETTDGSPLIHVLRTVPHLQSFALYSRYWTIDWETFEPHFQSALLEVFRSPNLTSLILEPLGHAPVEQICSLGRLKILTLTEESGTWDQTVSVFSPPPLDQKKNGRLEALTIAGLPVSRRLVEALSNPASALGISELREFSVQGSDPEFLDSIEKAMQMGADTIESFVWEMQAPFPFNPPKLGIMCNLRFLFVHFKCYSPEEFSGAFHWLVTTLHDSSFSRSLEEVIVILESNYLENGESVTDRVGSLQLENLDSVLGSSGYPNLRHVELGVLDLDSREITSEETDPVVSLLQRLSTKNILLVNGYNTYEGIIARLAARHH